MAIASSPSGLTASGLTAIVLAPMRDEPAAIAMLAVECARVGAGAVRLPAADVEWLRATMEAIAAATDLAVLQPDARPRDVILGSSPVTELALVLQEQPAGELIVGGREVGALLAGLAAGTHLRAGAADSSHARPLREEVQLVARAAALARLAGRPPMTSSQIRTHWNC